jgi:DNA-binding NtrC family response regulator
VLAAAAWEGNVRELRNVIERAAILAESDFIRERDLTRGLSHAGSSAVAPAASEAAGVIDAVPVDSPDALSGVERDHIIEVLARAGGNKAKAARMLGLDRRTLYRRLEAYAIRSVG